MQASHYKGPGQNYTCKTFRHRNFMANYITTYLTPCGTVTQIFHLYQTQQATQIVIFIYLMRCLLSSPVMAFCVVNPLSVIAYNGASKFYSPHSLHFCHVEKVWLQETTGKKEERGTQMIGESIPPPHNHQFNAVTTILWTWATPDAIQEDGQVERKVTAKLITSVQWS